MAPDNISKTGWAFPPEFNRQNGRVEMVYGSEDIRQSVAITLQTSVGERFLVPDFGCNLEPYVFEPLTPSLSAYLQDLVAAALRLHEPRITVDELSVSAGDTDGKFVILISYTEVRTGIKDTVNVPLIVPASSGASL
ncbi:GPW/gp25 family protein [Maridesulfovibrio sp.]|uniref:GPW/gp25 family protein n=1 Tax=Maridesulfovibrio sp. TaxID=2795000 RepID=UPI0039EE40A4